MITSLRTRLRTLFNLTSRRQRLVAAVAISLISCATATVSACSGGPLPGSNNQAHALQLKTPLATPTPSVGATTEYSTSVAADSPGAMILGPDGALWFTITQSQNIAGRITTSGAITEFAKPASSIPGGRGIAVGSDGNLWIAEHEQNAIAKVTPSGTVTEYPIPTPGGKPNHITAGPDGNLWFVEEYNPVVGRITTAGTITEFPIPSGHPGWHIVAGPDGALWFTETYVGVGRITTSGTVTNEWAFPGAVDLQFGPDGNLWLEPVAAAAGYGIGRMTPTGNETVFCCVSTSYNGVTTGITVGPDGNMWFTQHDQKLIGRVTMTGEITTFSGPTSGPGDIVAGPPGDRHMWFTEPDNHGIGEIHI